MTERAEPHSEREQLAIELRRLRVQAGITGRKMAEEIGGISQSKVSRIEAGTAMPTLPQVERWAEAADAPPDKRESLIKLVRRAFTEIEPWRTSLQSRPHLQHEIRERESQATLIRTFEPALVPGLLQTAQYARHVFGLSPLPSVQEGIPAAVHARMDRQLALYEPERTFEFLITESALRWCPGLDADRLLAPQLDRLSSLSTMENVSIGIIPDGQRALTWASHGFVIYEGHEADATFVAVEAIHASLTIHEPDSIDVYRHTWAALTRMAVFGDEARRTLTDLLSDYRGGAE